MFKLCEVGGESGHIEGRTGGTDVIRWDGAYLILPDYLVPPSPPWCSRPCSPHIPTARAWGLRPGHGGCGPRGCGPGPPHRPRCPAFAASWVLGWASVAFGTHSGIYLGVFLGTLMWFSCAQGSSAFCAPVCSENHTLEVLRDPVSILLDASILGPGLRWLWN